MPALRSMPTNGRRSLAVSSAFRHASGIDSGTVFSLSYSRSTWCTISCMISSLLCPLRRCHIRHLHAFTADEIAACRVCKHTHRYANITIRSIHARHFFQIFLLFIVTPFLYHLQIFTLEPPSLYLCHVSDESLA